jgi:hypothetical protein
MNIEIERENKIENERERVGEERGNERKQYCTKILYFSLMIT